MTGHYGYEARHGPDVIYRVRDPISGKMAQISRWELMRATGGEETWFCVGHKVLHRNGTVDGELEAIIQFPRRILALLGDELIKEVSESVALARREELEAGWRVHHSDLFDYDPLNEEYTASYVRKE